jgi:YfiH family protein
VDHIEPSFSRPLNDGRIAHVIATDRSHGDLSVGSAPGRLDQHRRCIVDAPWVWFHQVHGASVVTVAAPGEGAGQEADAGCTRCSDAPIAVQVADCAPVAFIDPAGVVGVAHAGWRGLMAGVLERTVEAMVDMGASAPVAIIGPCIRPDAYEFGQAELDATVAAIGPTVRSVTAQGTPALDIPAGVSAVLDRMGVELVADIGSCTAADPARRWSHRARGDRGRQALVVWIGDDGGGQT